MKDGYLQIKIRELDYKLKQQMQLAENLEKQLQMVIDTKKEYKTLFNKLKKIDNFKDEVIKEISKANKMEVQALLSQTDDLIGQEVNIAAESEISIGNLARMLIERINPKVKIVTAEERIRPAKSEVERLLGSNKKLKQFTDWQPKYKLDQGLSETVDWFSNEEILKQYKHHVYNV